jgi:hypothetical protein
VTVRRHRLERDGAAKRHAHRRGHLGAGAVVMLLALAAYVAMHTPLRIAMAHLLGFSSRGCYLCARTITGSDIADAAAAAVLLIVAVCAASATTSRFTGERYERALTFGLAMTGFITIPAAIIAGLGSLTGGTYLEPPAGPLLASIPALAVVVGAMRHGWRPSLPSPPALTTPLLRAVAVCAAALLAAAALVSLLHPPTQGDALSYHAPNGVFLWSYGNLTTMLNRAPGISARAHPGTAELWYGLLRLVGGERLADLGQLPFAVLGAAAAYAFTRRTGLGAGSAMLAACAFILIPLVGLQVGTQANDVVGCALLMTAIALASAPVSTWRADRALAVGLALGLTTATKLALLPGVLVVGAIVMVALLRRPERRANTILALSLGFLLPIAPWWIRNVARQGNPIYPQAIPLLGRGVNVGANGAFDSEYVPRAAAWPLYPLFEPIDDRSGYGALFAVTLLPGLFACWMRGRRWPLALLGTSFAVTLPLWWRYTMHEPRFLLPYVGLAATLVPWSIVAVRRHSRRLAAAIIVGAALFSVIESFDQAILPLARLPTDRSEFYDRVWAVDPVAVSLPERDGLLQVTGYGLGRVDYASTYPLLGRSQHRRLVPLDASGIRGSQATVVQTMKAAGIRYAYVAALAESRREVEQLFARPTFRLLHFSAVVPGELIGARRNLFRPAPRADVAGEIYRYMFELNIRTSGGHHPE